MNLRSNIIRTLVIVVLIVSAVALIKYRHVLNFIILNNTTSEGFRQKELELTAEDSDRDVKFISGKELAIPLSYPDSLNVSLFAENIGKVRDLEFSPSQILFASIPSEGRIVALPDQDQNGIADDVVTVIDNLNKPHGFTFYEDYLFVSEETKVVRYVVDPESLTAVKNKDLFTLPEGGRHTTRTLEFDNEGNLFVSLGSTCDVCEEENDWISTVLISDGEGRPPRIYAKGLRNAVFIKFNPEDGKLYGTEMGRDFLGDNLPPDEINRIEEGKDYGWPYCYGDKVYDGQFGRKDRSVCAQTESPLFEIQAHSAPLGLTFVEGSVLDPEWIGDLLVSYHGSWNSSVPVGYKVVRLDIEQGKVVAEEDLITGFISDGKVYGRPVDLEFNNDGLLFLSDDKANSVYLISRRK